ncbi:MAG: hypothetical protein WA005_16720 [Candidatus Binataceae bacterium]
MTPKAPPFFYFTLDSYVAIIIVSVGIFAIFFAGVTWATTYVRAGRIGAASIWIGFVLPATIPLAMQLLATAGILYRSRLAWTQSWMPTAQSTDIMLTYLFGLLVISVIFPAVVVVNVAWEERQIATVGRRVHQYNRQNEDRTP